MKYADYKGFTKAYVVVRVTGNGVMEDRFVEHDVVYETDDGLDAQNKATDLEAENNSKGDIESTWYNNRYHVNVNTLSKYGRKLRSKFRTEFDEGLKRGLEEGRYNIIKKGGMTFYMDNRLNKF